MKTPPAKVLNLSACPAQNKLCVHESFGVARGA
jgi:hypothetical protein